MTFVLKTAAMAMINGVTVAVPELWEQLEREKKLVVLLKNSCEMATDGWCQALKYWRRALYSGIRRANRWMWFSFLSNMFWMILVAVILSKGEKIL